MAFYTSVNRYGNSILYRGYSDNGSPIQQKYKFVPKLYNVSNTPTKLKAFGTDNYLKEIRDIDSMKDAKNYLESMADIPNKKIYGTTNYIHQFITSKYPDNISFDINQINVVNFDIEVASDDGFPTPEEAAYPVISIALKSSKSSVY